MKALLFWTGEEERLFKKLNEAYIDSRYNDEFTINEGELTYMVGRVRMLQKLGWEICGEWINTYSKSVENMSEELKTRVKYLTSSEIEDVNEIRKMSREVERKKLAEAEAIGEARGFSKGEESGRKKEKLDIARKLLEEGVAVSDVCRVIGLTAEEILEIK